MPTTPVYPYPPGRTRDRETVSIMSAADRCGVSRRTIYNWIAAGKVEYVRTAGGAVRIFTDTLFREADGAPLADSTRGIAV